MPGQIKHGQAHTLAYKRYLAQVGHCRARGIPFEFSFQEWVKWWEDHLGPDWLLRRGRKKKQFCMARKYDSGSYVEPNVMCILNEVNGSDRARNGTAGGGTKGNAKLTEQQVKDIFFARGSNSRVATLFNVSPSTVSYIKRRIIWREITKDLKR